MEGTTTVRGYTTCLGESLGARYFAPHQLAPPLLAQILQAIRRQRSNTGER